MHPGFSTRLGFLPKNISFHQPLWIHAVSVGEAMAVKNLVIRLKQLYPDTQCVISTVTSTGNKIVRSFASENDVVLYLPLDISFIVSRVIDAVKPAVFVIAETELWPNMITCLNKRKIPVIVINGRLSDSSFKGYSAVKFLCAPLLNAVALFCVQTELDASRFRALGVRKDKVRVTGNMKFDS
ncbi:MAG: glycosyltransferase N-terminal domain-containing protein, partial [Candidatus Omnitrophica bacterium]|nr:glycosyltransferase N-terminal domain-containing protein [Candidatus Omnitrophota bacterium]